MADDALRPTGSLTSLTSIGFSGPTITSTEEPPQEDNTNPRLKKDLPKTVNHWRFAALKEVSYLSYHTKKELSDYYQVGIICHTHNRIAIQLYDDQLCGLPCFAVPAGGTQKVLCLAQVLEKVIPKSARRETILTSKPRIESILQVEDPRSGQMVNRKTVYHWISSKKCCQHTDTMFWISLDELKNGMEIDSLEQSPIILRDDQAYNLLNLVVNGLQVQEPIIEMDTDIMLAFANDESLPYKKFLEAGCFSEKIVSSLLHEFICHCWPATVMSFPLFCSFLAKVSPPVYRQFMLLDTAKRIFYAICNKSRYVLEFSELIIGLLMLDENLCTMNRISPQFIGVQDTRLRLQFRYYDTFRKGYLVNDNIILLLKEYVDECETKVKLGKELKDDAGRKKFMEDWFKLKDKAKYNFQDFRELILFELPKKLEKIEKSGKNPKDVPDVYSSLFKAKFDIALQITRLFDFSCNSTNRKPKNKYSFYKPITRRCDGCRTPYRLSDSKIQLSIQGRVLAIFRILWTQAAQSDPKQVLSADLPDSRNYRVAIDILLRIKNYADQMFKKNATAEDELLGRWNYSRKADQIKAVDMVLSQVKEIFLKEKRVVPVESPAMVFGDVHGNLRDLNHFFNSNLFGKLPFMAPNKLVFLGDYVDRGDWSLEVVVLLFCLKILAPESVFLVRGNHELRSVQHEFGFLIECRNKLGLDYWRQFNEVFDCLPVAALIDGRIYGAHGGIPTSGTTLEQLRRAPIPLSNPSVECHEAWEAMWNDPLNDKDVGVLRVSDTDLIKKTGGFVLNPYRGTGFRFLTEAVQKFLKRNELDFVVRAHEVQMLGFGYYNHGLTISVFSTSNYIGSVNSAGVLMLTDNKIRCIQIERTYKPETLEGKQ